MRRLEQVFEHCGIGHVIEQLENCIDGGACHWDLGATTGNGDTVNVPQEHR
jgi:hypothetical protein